MMCGPPSNRRRSPKQLSSKCFFFAISPHSNFGVWNHMPGHIRGGGAQGANFFFETCVWALRNRWCPGKMCWGKKKLRTLCEGKKRCQHLHTQKPNNTFSPVDATASYPGRSVKKGHLGRTQLSTLTGSDVSQCCVERIFQEDFPGAKNIRALIHQAS